MSLFVIAFLAGVLLSRPAIRCAGWMFMHFIYAPYWMLGNGGIRQGLPGLWRYYFKRWNRESSRNTPHTWDS